MSPTFHLRLSIAVGWLTLFLVGTDLFVISPLLPVVSLRYQIDASTAGWTITSFSLAYLLAAPLLGGLSDRHGRRRVIVGGLVALGIANALTSVVSDLTGSFVALVLTRAAAGFSAAAIAPSVYAATGDMVTPARRATWLAVVGSGLLLALTFGAPLGGVLAASLGVRPVFSLIALLALLLAVANAVAWRAATAGGPSSAASSAALASALASPGRPTATRSPAGATLPTVLWSTVLFGGYTYLGVGLADARLTAAETALMIVFFGSGMVAGNLCGGWTADRFGGERVIGASYVGMGIGWLAVAKLLAGMDRGHAPLLVLGLSLALTSFVAQLFFPAQQARLARLFSDRRAAALAWNNSALYLGMSIGSAFGGLLLGRAGFPSLLVTLAVVALASAAIVHRVVHSARAPSVSAAA